MLLLIVFELIRRRKLFAGYSLIWVAACLVVLVLSLFRSIIDKMGKMLGIAYPPSALYLIIFAFTLMILIDYSIKFSTLNKQVKDLASVVAILQQKLEKDKNK